MTQRSNEEWLANLRGEAQNQALAELRRLLMRGLGAALAGKLAVNQTEVIEDFVQDALLRILDNLDSFRGESQFLTWAQKIAVRVAYSELRRLRWKDIALEDLLLEDSGSDYVPAVLADSGPNPEQITTQQAMIELVRGLVLDELTDKQKQAMVAVMIKGIPIEEVARKMDTNRNALYKLMHDARKKLGRSLNEHGLTAEEVLAVFET